MEWHPGEGYGGIKETGTSDKHTQYGNKDTKQEHQQQLYR